MPIRVSLGSNKRANPEKLPQAVSCPPPITKRRLTEGKASATLEASSSCPCSSASPSTSTVPKSVTDRSSPPCQARFANWRRKAEGPAAAPWRPLFLRTPASQAKPSMPTIEAGQPVGADNTFWCHRTASGPSSVSTLPSHFEAGLKVTMFSLENSIYDHISIQKLVLEDY